MESKLGVTVEHFWHIECRDKDGNLKWTEEGPNVVTQVGKEKYLDATLKTGLTTPAWYVGLKDSFGTDVAEAHTMASHVGWAEITPYSNANRPTWNPGTISSKSVDNSASKAIFSINATASVAGAFMVDNATKGGSTGVLLGGLDFSAARSVVNGDTLNVTVTCSFS